MNINAPEKGRCIHTGAYVCVHSQLRVAGKQLTCSRCNVHVLYVLVSTLRVQWAGFILPAFLSGPDWNCQPIPGVHALRK